MNIFQQFIATALKKSFPSTKSFLNFKKSFFSKNKLPQPTNADLREVYEKMVAQKIIKRNSGLEQAMLSRAIRTQSGVAIVAVLTKPSTCPGKCMFCPTEKNMPKSYLSNEPAVMRAIMNKFHPYKQIQSRLRALELNGHYTDKIELIVMGGTFSYFPKRYQKWFIKECFRACNDYPKKQTATIGGSKTKESLKHEQKRNEQAKHRIVGLTLETRPDYIDEKEILNFRQLGCTRVEIGVQSVFDDILKLNKRGHLTKDTIRATKLLKDAGFKINYHIMPGLYGSSPTKDFKMFQELFSGSDFQPDMLKIYPTVVIKNAKLYKLWKNREYQAMTDRQFENLVIKIKNEIIPPYTRIQRLVRDVPLPSIEAGPKISNLRQLVAEKADCQCIRCREIKGEFSAKNKIILNRIDYKASNGREIFLQFIDDNNKLYALLRLRIPSFKNEKLYQKLPVLRNSAIIREIHTYGKLTAVGQKDKTSPQHIGLGKKLIKEAEKIARRELTKLDIPKPKQKIIVISGIGVRAYYRKLGYRLQNTYMVKRLR
ncbi:MAG TPA: tRNA uridine(34) 5-carboxymethylaminomethyl modification radical SAM/GNAT enzyme Elp3 [Candidatus Moranbacteria bacterium]|nr:tRNA uridine(34) 5-carboxymethylaminomethyl modification radical SAM/GNAT enzyme Elp3 [Candidatus Moranbacteria bacterium]